LAVSLLFCFCNGEVLAALKRKFSHPGKLGGATGDYTYGRTNTTVRMNE
jgi:hypothetical protein